MASEARARWTHLGLAAAAVVLTLAVTEAAIRFSFPIPARGYGAWAGYPGSRLALTIAPDGFAAVHRYNRYGFRGPDFPVERRTRVRIACVGDSYTEGLGAREDASWPAQLGRRLADLDAEVLNLGDAGSEPERYSRILSEVALPLDPTDVVVCLLPSDLRGGIEPHEPAPRTGFADPFRDGRGAAAPLVRLVPGWTYLVERAAGRWPVQKGPYWNRWDDAAAEGAVLWHVENLRIPERRAREMVRERLERMIDPAVLSASRRGEFNPTAVAANLILPFLAYRARVADLRLPPAELAAATRAWLAGYVRTCRDRGIRPWLLYFPLAPLVVDGAWGPFTDAVYERRPRVTGDVSVRDLVTAIAAELDLPVIDLTDVLAAHGSERLFLRYDTHPTARAYELAADAVAARLRPAL